MNITTIGTHDGKFHSDEVYSVGLLGLLYPDAKIIRTRDSNALSYMDAVLDVGGVYDKSNNRFDHHQTNGAGRHPNGIPFSTFALVWDAFGLRFCDNNEAVYKRLFKEFVSTFDAYDNGVDTYEITIEGARVLELQDLFDKYLNPAIGEPASPEDFDRLFMQALELAKIILQRALKHATANIIAEQYFYDSWLASPDKRYVVLDAQARPGEQANNMEDLLYYVYQAPSNIWHVQAMKKQKDSFEIKKALPKSWAGQKGSELAATTGISDAIFCSNSLHLCAAKSKAGAIALLELAIQL